MMPNKTLYVRDEDVSIWDESEKLAPGGISPLVSKLLREFVTSKKVSLDGMHKITVRVPAKDAPVRKSFQGRWIIDESSAVEVLNDDDGVQRIGDSRVAVALTAKGKLAVYHFEWDEDGWATLQVYNDFEDMKTSKTSGYPEWPSNVLAAVAEALGQPYEEVLDI